MQSALIGYTGFVGGNLARQHTFTSCFNSKNIREIEGQKFDLVVCAGVQAKKWWANQNPVEDWAQIERLLNSLASVRAEKFVLVSTIDVYPRPCGVDENTPIAVDAANAYGFHRYRVEETVRQQFASCCTIRLPGLFGDGLKKNVIFDLVHDNGLEVICPESSFQYYFLDRLWTDIQRCQAAGLELINFATEPVATSEIIQNYFPGKSVGAKHGPQASYDFRTRHSAQLGGAGGYLYNKETVLSDLETYLARVQPSKP